MDRQTIHERATSNVLAWSTHGANAEQLSDEEAGADGDEPPDRSLPRSPSANTFKRTTVPPPRDHQQSLLTKALQSQSEEEIDHDPSYASRRRRSMNSTISFASTELTTDTGITTPARTSSPSPRLIPIVGLAPVVDMPRMPSAVCSRPKDQTEDGGHKDPAVQALEKKRCISFACAAKPVKAAQPVPAPAPTPVPAAPATAKPAVAAANPPTAGLRRPCIKFACPAKPTTPSTPPKQPALATQKPASNGYLAPEKDMSPSATRKLRSPSAGRRRPGTPRRISSNSPVLTRCRKYLTAETTDLQNESARFHVFASDEPQEDDWIRQDKTAIRRKLTIDDTLKFENAIRRIGQEAEEEAEQEEQEAEDQGGDDEDDDQNADEDDNDEDEDGDDAEDAEEEAYTAYGSDDASEGYRTDNEIGFADSDDEDDGLLLWTTGQVAYLGRSGGTPVPRRLSVDDQSDSSTFSDRRHAMLRYQRNRFIDRTSRADTPELPDSTDFVCGTLDEDRPLEEAYISCIAARKQQKLHPISQDIDPSFPTSELEEEDEDDFKSTLDNDDQIWVHGEIEDLHHEQERGARRKKKGNPSPRRYRSPPPKGRGRSPRRLFDHHSPKRAKSPMPRTMITSPPASPVNDQGIAFKSLAFRPGLTVTKSLPRAPGVFHQHMKARGRVRSNTLTKHKHVRGAIDIFKGLEQKRQRRKEKFNQKYCNRARKGQIPERKPQPGRGAERMREIGLLMAGKVGQGNYVLSI